MKMKSYLLPKEYFFFLDSLLLFGFTQCENMQRFMLYHFDGDCGRKEAA